MSKLYDPNLPVVSGYDDKFDKAKIDDVVKAAKDKDPAALYELAERYRLGTGGVQEDQARAVMRYKEVLEYQTNLTAMYRIGFLLSGGACGDEDIEEGLEYYKAAYSLGDADSAVQLGVEHEFGGLVPKDLDKAKEYYSFAISHGRGDAAFNLGEVYLAEENREEARKCYEQALAFDNSRENAEQRLANLDRITANVALPGEYIQQAKSRMDSGNYMDACKIITEGNDYYPDNLDILSELVWIDDVVLHAAYHSGSLNDKYKDLCRMLLHHIETLREAKKDPDYMAKYESDISFFLADITCKRRT